MIKSVIEVIRHPKIQVPLLAVMMSYIVGILIWQQNKQHIADPIQSALAVKASVKRLANKVTTGLHINNFPEFSFRRNKFTLDAIVWFKFPVGTESIHTVENFSFKNGSIKEKSLPKVKVIGEQVVISYQVIVEFKTPLDYRFFPISDHRLNITLENRLMTPNELCFLSDVNNFEISDDSADLLVSTWKPQHKRVTTGYTKSILNEKNDEMEINYPCVTYTIDFANNSLRDLISLYFSMFILFFICFLALLVDIKNSELRIGMIAGAVPTLVLFRLVIDTIAPTAGMITKVDHLYYLLVTLALIILLFQIYILLSERKHKNLTGKSFEKEQDRLSRANGIVYLFVFTMLLSVFTWIHI